MTNLLPTKRPRDDFDANSPLTLYMFKFFESGSFLFYSIFLYHSFFFLVKKKSTQYDAHAIVNVQIIEMDETDFYKEKLVLSHTL